MSTETSAPPPTRSVVVQAIRYAVCALPLDHPDADSWTVHVTYLPRSERWAVIRFHEYLGRDLTWSYIPDEESPEHDQWWDDHRYATAKEAIEYAAAGASRLLPRRYTTEAARGRAAPMADPLTHARRSCPPGPPCEPGPTICVICGRPATPHATQERSDG